MKRLSARRTGPPRAQCDSYAPIPDHENKRHRVRPVAGPIFGGRRVSTTL